MCLEPSVRYAYALSITFYVHKPKVFIRLINAIHTIGSHRKCYASDKENMFAICLYMLWRAIIKKKSQAHIARNDNALRCVGNTFKGYSPI